MTSSQPDHSLLRQQLEQAQQTGDLAAQAALLMQLGKLAHEEEHSEDYRNDRRDTSDAYGLSQGFYAQAWDLYQQMGDQRGQAEALTALSNLLAQVGDSREEHIAHDFYEEALVLYASLDDHYAYALIMAKIPDVIWQSGPAEHGPLYDRAMSAFRRIHDPIEQANLLVVLADNTIGPQNRPYMLLAYEEALAIYQQEYDHFQAATVLERLGHIQADQDIALSYRIGAAHIYEHIQALQEAAFVWFYAADEVYPDIKAYQYLKRAVYLSEKSGDRHDQAIYLCEMGNVAAKNKLFQESYHLLEQAASIFEQLEDYYEQIRCLRHLAAAHADNNAIDMSRRCYEQSMAIDAHYDYGYQASQLLWDWSQLESAAGYLDQAIELCERALETEKASDPDGDPRRLEDWEQQLVTLKQRRDNPIREDISDD